mmetsp:Transcript_46105/g.141991  ORF Transcript_46105/g.141991 Transcript_46105/m.141991 type:complete len:293 (-) Transcript_46105:164-1042(-)
MPVAASSCASVSGSMMPDDENIASTVSSSASEHASLVAYRVQPLPTCSGVLGIVRTTRGCFAGSRSGSVLRMRSIDQPATMDTTRWFSFSGRRLSSRVIPCGFTASTMTSASTMAASASRVVVAGAAVMALAAPSKTFRLLSHSTYLPNGELGADCMPTAMALAMTPKPRKAMVLLPGARAALVAASCATRLPAAMAASVAARAVAAALWFILAVPRRPVAAASTIDEVSLADICCTGVDFPLAARPFERAIAAAAAPAGRRISELCSILGLCVQRSERVVNGCVDGDGLRS